jgi:hypothetical protein
VKEGAHALAEQEWPAGGEPPSAIDLAAKEERPFPARLALVGRQGLLPEVVNGPVGCRPEILGTDPILVSLDKEEETGERGLAIARDMGLVEAGQGVGIDYDLKGTGQPLQESRVFRRQRKS